MSTTSFSAVFTVALALLAAGRAAAAERAEPLRIGTLTQLSEPAQPAAAEASVPLSTRSAWRFDAFAWIWLMGIEGDIGVKGRTADVSASFADVIDASDSVLAFSGRLEVGYGKFGGYIDGLWADLGADDVSGPMGQASVDVVFEQTIVDFGLMYRLVDRVLPAGASGNPRKLTFDVFGGGRYVGMDVTFDPAMASESTSSEDWIDPIVGAKLVVPIGGHWHLGTSLDIGGFGVASDLTWNATAMFGYDFRLFNTPAAVHAGYRAIGWDYTNGSGNDQFTWDVIEHGIILGFSMHF